MGREDDVDRVTNRMRADYPHVFTGIQVNLEGVKANHPNWKVGPSGHRYHFMVGNEIVRRGHTADLARREKEHRIKYPSGHIVKIG